MHALRPGQPAPDRLGGQRQQWRGGAAHRFEHGPQRVERSPVALEASKFAGALCGKAGNADVVDAALVVMAAALRAIIWTSDPEDIRGLASHSGVRPAPVVCGV